MSSQEDKVLVDRLTSQILFTEELWLKKAERIKLNQSASTAEVRARLMAAPPSLLERVQNDFNNVLRVFEKCEDENVNPWDDREFFKIFMREVGVSYPKDFLEKIEAGHLIEGYDLNRRQVFRNLRFMEICSYSLLEILSSEWTELYDRPSSITETMLLFCDEILWSSNKTIRFEVPRHFIREVRSQEKNVFEIGFQYLTPLFSGPNRPFGMLGSCSAKVIPTDQFKDNVAFI